jgi:hypothetical protein
MNVRILVDDSRRRVRRQVVVSREAVGVDKDGTARDVDARVDTEPSEAAPCQG